jgi:hypothetical protein
MMNEAKIQEIKTLVGQLFADGKTPSETFGMSWDMLAKIENDRPELTCTKDGKQAQTD